MKKVIVILFLFIAGCKGDYFGEPQTSNITLPQTEVEIEKINKSLDNARETVKKLKTELHCYNMKVMCHNCFGIYRVQVPKGQPLPDYMYHNKCKLCGCKVQKFSIVH